MNATTTNKLLRAAGATRSYPTTRAGIDKQLERIAAGKDGHRPTLAHPYRGCFGGKHDERTHRDSTRGMGQHGYCVTTFGPPKSCAEWIAEQETARRERQTA